jgi:hypothetical protein
MYVKDCVADMTVISGRARVPKNGGMLRMAERMKRHRGARPSRLLRLRGPQVLD